MEEAVKHCHTSPNTSHQNGNMPPAEYSSPSSLQGRKTVVIIHENLFNICVLLCLGWEHVGMFFII